MEQKEKAVNSGNLDSLGRYYEDIKNFKYLSKKEEVELFKLIREGNQRAINTLIESNLKFVVSIAMKYQNKGMELEDLISEGNIGLIKAIEKFDETQGNRFLTYAGFWIRESIRQALKIESRIVRLSNNEIELSSKINKAISQFAQENGREPSPDEIADMLDKDESEVSLAMSATKRPISIDAPTSDDDDRTYIEKNDNADISDPETDMIKSQQYEALKSYVSELQKNEQFVISLLYGIDCKPMEIDKIAEKVGLPRKKIQQLKTKAKRHLKEQAQRNK